MNVFLKQHLRVKDISHPVETEGSGGTNITLAVPLQKILITPSRVFNLSKRVPGEQTHIDAEKHRKPNTGDFR